MWDMVSGKNPAGNLSFRKIFARKKNPLGKSPPSFIVYFFRLAFEIFGVAIFWVMRERGGIEGYNDFYSN